MEDTRTQEIYTGTSYKNEIEIKPKKSDIKRIA